MVGNIWIFPSSPLETSIPQEKESSPSQSAAGRPVDAFSEAGLPVIFSPDPFNKPLSAFLAQVDHFKCVLLTPGRQPDKSCGDELIERVDPQMHPLHLHQAILRRGLL